VGGFTSRSGGCGGARQGVNEKWSELRILHGTELKITVALA